ncbi:MAG: (Fe-S)-binding protein [Euryarchaeota archaeon]|nr:(Fe-S)-binding protein [Euryarchaeota archaeon]
MIYFRGCVIREKLNNISEATEIILQRADVDYITLKDENCCGSFLLRTGFHDDAVEVMTKTLDKIGNDKILTSCAGCYRTLKYDYSNILDANLDVTHTSQFFGSLIAEGKLELKKVSEKVTYHDPCHLGRHCREYDAPRNILNKTADLVEMDRNKEKSRCCGAGGGVKSAFSDITEEISKMRIDDAKITGANIIASACPFCILNLENACRGCLKILDLSEIILMGFKDE